MPCLSKGFEPTEQVPVVVAPPGDGGQEELAAELGEELRERHERLALRGGAQGVELPVEAEGAMDYDTCARRQLLIGSGMVEAGCKFTVGGPLVSPGMHWRFQNGLRIVELRAVLRSGLTIVV